VSAAEPPPDSLAGPLRWLGRAVVVVVALWFITDGLRERWPAAATVATVLVWVGVALAAAFVVVGLVYLARRGREG
jgi:hypothetical protein